MVTWHTITEKEAIEKQRSSEKGLSETEAKNRLEIYGKNQLVKLRRLNALKIFATQFTSFLVIILIVAAVISLLIGHMIDFYVILGIVTINSLFGFVQEYKAEKAIEKLKSMLVPKAEVLRNNHVLDIDSREIVPGDILILRTGDKIMADARVISCAGLKVNEASLTGESIAEEKSLGVLGSGVVMADRTNMVYQGTEVVNGSCKAIVVSTGMNTEYGKIASLVASQNLTFFNLLALSFGFS